MWTASQGRTFLSTGQQPEQNLTRAGRPLELLSIPEAMLSGFRNHVGPVAANREAGLIAASSPQGNALAVIDAAPAG